jgi:hypothetical protein
MIMGGGGFELFVRACEVSSQWVTVFLVNPQLFHRGYLGGYDAL